LYQFVMGNRVPTTVEFMHGDMNRDGTLNVADILLLQKQLLQVWLGIEGGTVLAKADIGRQQNPTTTARSVLDWLITPAWALTGNNGVLYYVHNDPLGTPQALTNEAGTVVWTASYDPFGKATVNEDPDGDGNPITFNVRMPGQYEDVETGLYYNGYRYYSPETGRYLSSDPIGLNGGLNTYSYVGSNPLRFSDPLGLMRLNPYNPNDWENCVSVTTGFGNLEQNFSYTKELSKIWIGLYFNNIGLGVALDQRGKTATLEADFYDIYLKKMALVKGVNYTPYVEMLFFCEDTDKCGRKTTYEVGPLKFSNGKSFRLEKIENTWWTTQNEFRGRVPLPLPFRIPL